MNLPPFQLGLTAVTIAAWTLHENEIYRWMFLSPWWICQTLLGRENWDLLNGMGQSCCRPEGDQKRSDRGEKFLGYFSLRTSVVQQPETFVQNSNFANASLLRNLVLHYSFHLKTPPWKLWQHENLFEVLVDEGSARVVVEPDHPPRVNHPHKILGASGHLRSEKTSSVVWKKCFFLDECKGLNSVHYTVETRISIMIKVVFFKRKVLKVYCTWSE